MDIVSKITVVIINPLIYLLGSLALVVFLFGLVQYIYAGGNSDKRADGSRYIIWGVVGLFVIVGAYGLVAVVQNTVLQIAS